MKGVGLYAVEVADPFYFEPPDGVENINGSGEDDETEPKENNKANAEGEKADNEADDRCPDDSECGEVEHR